MKLSCLAFLIAFHLPAHGLLWAGHPITIDGLFDDWAEVPVAFADQNGDGVDEDFGELKITNDNRFLFLLFRFNSGELSLQELNQIKLFIDTDNRPQSGLAIHGIGAELEWCFGLRQGKYHSTSGELALTHSAITLRTAPTITSRVFEMAIALDSAPLTRDETQVADTVAVVFRTSGGYDLMPDSPGGVVYKIDTTPVPEPEPVPLYRFQDNHLRVLTYNVLFGGLLIPDRQPHFQRILRALNADILAFQEQDNPEQVKEVISQWYQDLNLHVAGAGGRTVVSRFPILDEAVLTTSGRSLVVLIDTRSLLGTELLLINSHFACCDNNFARQRDADEIIAILRDWRTNRTGPFPLPENTPIVHLGDFNLVGSSAQLRTLVNGDILDELDFGNDFAPDWDGSPITDLFSRHNSNRMGYTWRNDNGSFAPGKLDYILFTDSVIELGNHFVLNTLSMSEDELDASGLQAQDTNQASDHLPRIVDITPGTAVSVDNPGMLATPNGIYLYPAYPNPFNPTTSIRYRLPVSAHTTVTIFDVLGREVEVLVNDVKPAGEHSVVFDAADLASGTYIYQLSAAGQKKARRLLLVK